MGGQIPVASAAGGYADVYPVEFAYCSGFTPPTTENLYVTDSINYLILNFSVDPSAGTLKPVPVSPGVPGLATGSVPSGVAVDPCNRFLYVSNTGPGSNANTVSAYTICSAVNLVSQPQNCREPARLQPAPRCGDALCCRGQSRTFSGGCVRRFSLRRGYWVEPSLRLPDEPNHGGFDGAQSGLCEYGSRAELDCDSKRRQFYVRGQFRFRNRWCPDHFGICHHAVDWGLDAATAGQHV